MIGKFEENCLLALIRSGPASTPAQIHEVLCDHAGQEFQFGAVYTTLDRMEAKGWVKAEARTQRSGARKRRYFTITGNGQDALSRSLKGTRQLAEGLVIRGFATGGAE